MVNFKHSKRVLERFVYFKIKNDEEKKMTKKIKIKMKKKFNTPSDKNLYIV
jgi:hypothetical protein